MKLSDVERVAELKTALERLAEVGSAVTVGPMVFYFWLAGDKYVPCELIEETEVRELTKVALAKRKEAIEAELRELGVDSTS